MSFKSLKTGRKARLEKLQVQATQQNKSYVDERYWSPTKDKAGNAFATIRFLPEAEDNDLTWVEYYSHGFKNPKNGKWYIENSRTSIGQPDPLGELNNQLWNNGTEVGKEQARHQKRKKNFVSNILVINDTANPENNGKVFLFRYGVKIHDMIMDKLNPQFEDEEAVNVFDFWDGANFKLKQRSVDGWPNYDKSEFETPSALSEDDDELEKIYNKMYDLREFKSESFYKPYDELKKKLMDVLGMTGSTFGITEDEEPRSSVGREEASSMEDVSDDDSEEDDDDDNDVSSYFDSLVDED